MKLVCGTLVNYFLGLNQPKKSKYLLVEFVRSPHKYLILLEINTARAPEQLLQNIGTKD